MHGATWIDVVGAVAAAVSATAAIVALFLANRAATTSARVETALQHVEKQIAAGGIVNIAGLAPGAPLTFEGGDGGAGGTGAGGGGGGGGRRRVWRSRRIRRRLIRTARTIQTERSIQMHPLLEQVEMFQNLSCRTRPEGL